jgi:hypothetical protein
MEKGRLSYICILALWAFGHGGENVMANDRQYSINLPDFRSPPSEEMSRAVDKVIECYDLVVADVLNQLRDYQLSSEAKVYAIYLLGRLRASAAVTILLDNIAFKATKVDPKGGIGRWGMYPAQEALVRIGTPAVNMILDRLPSEREELRRKLMCSVISDVEGKAFAKLAIKIRFDEESDPANKENLQLALKYLESVPN